ncbi:MAG: FAD-binding protein [Castellaniella sp.]|uniref:FAD-binding protein n=1 Tax=Castellaniella sp. TaxID=1955812 RepID=UPI0012017870|nr:FAD-binding protein [Castellaniella sp.]TAN29100.1 MAG: FAD-binding protein [Castellaniella sp.]
MDGVNAAALRSDEAFDVVTSDVLVLGGGVAGYQAATVAARAGASVHLVARARGASPFILGFNASLAQGAPGDSAEQFYQDTFEGGYRLGDPSLIRTLAEQASIAFDELQHLGVSFESRDGRPALRHLSGSRFPRSVYVAKGTGNAILRVLVGEAKKSAVTEHSGLRVLALLKLDGRVWGALAADPRTGRSTVFLAANTVLAMGGIGGIYGDSTYPVDVEGGSYTLALDAGAVLRDMEFVQFEPTVVATPPGVRGMEMPTAMLGDGAVLKNTLGERFMCRYHPDGCEKQIEKARMALFIQKEIDEGRGTPEGAVYFDATVLSPDVLNGYVTHRQRLLKAGVDPQTQPVQVHPAAHSLMGGVRIDARCQSDVAGLLVCGEAAGGLHGASRIAGNGAADAITFGRLAGLSACADGMHPDDARRNQVMDLVRRLLDGSGNAGEDEGMVQGYIDRVSTVMSTAFGIRRTRKAMEEGVRVLEAVYEEVLVQWTGSPFHPLARARGVTLVALAVARSALARNESRGAHFRTDYPERDDAHYGRSSFVRLGENGRIVLDAAG